MGIASVTRISSKRCISEHLFYCGVTVYPRILTPPEKRVKNSASITLAASLAENLLYEECQKIVRAMLPPTDAKADARGSFIVLSGATRTGLPELPAVRSGPNILSSNVKASKKAAFSAWILPRRAKDVLAGQVLRFGWAEVDLQWPSGNSHFNDSRSFLRPLRRLHARQNGCASAPRKSDPVVLG